MKAPDDILKKVEALEAKNREYEEVKKRAAKAEEERIERIEKYRQSKMNELMPAADKIMQWINEFSNDFNDDGQRILAVNYSIYLYTGRFWRGEPIPESQISCCAVLSLRKERILSYQELHKGHTSYEVIVGNTKSLIENLPPDFLLKTAAAIEDGTVWEYINRSIH